MVPSDQTTWQPWCFDVEITARCDLGCRYCYLEPSAGDMTTGTADSVMRVASRSYKRWPWKPAEINIYGGEPFHNPGILRHIVASASLLTPRPALSVFTNGATATKGDVEWCVEHGVRPRRSSAGCPEAADLTRPGQYTDRWLREGELWKDYSATRRIAVTPETAQYAYDSVRWLHQCGYYGPVDFATDDYAAWPDDAIGKYEESMTRLADEFVRQRRIGRSLGVENFTAFGNAMFGQGRVMVIGCGAAWGTMGITWDGHVVPCHRFFRERRNSPMCGGRIDDIADGQATSFGAPLVSIIDGWSRGLERDECVSCEARQCCPRGCIHVSIATSGCLNYSPPHRCRCTRMYADLARWINAQLGGEWWMSAATPCEWTEDK